VEEKNKDLFFDIDLGNLFSQWHPDVRKLTSNLNEETTLEIIKSSEVKSFDITGYKKLLNFTNTKECKKILNRILDTKNKTNFLSILKERDRLHPRYCDRGYSIEEIYSLVEENNYHPILFLELKNNYYIIDGRTRLYCCLFLSKPAKVRILSEQDLYESIK